MLDRQAKKRLIKVLRLQPGDSLEVYSPGQRWRCRLAQVLQHGVRLQVLEQLPAPEPPRLRLVLGQGMIKAEKFEWLIQKATELGISEIVPILTQRSVIRPANLDVKVQRWNEIAEHAAGQSENSYPTQVHTPETLARFLQREQPALKLLLHERHGSLPLQELLQQPTANSIIFVVGPEGGWAPEETSAILAADFRKVHLEITNSARRNGWTCSDGNITISTRRSYGLRTSRKDERLLVSSLALFSSLYKNFMHQVKKAIFPAAGLGTRFLPATKAQPKEMLPLVDKPLIQYGIEEALASGIDNIIIVTGRGKYAIEDHFDVSYELEKILEQRGETGLLQTVRSISDMINVSYVRQKEALGIGHAILTARELIGTETFACFLGDDVIDSEVPCMKQLLAVYYEKQNPVVAIEEVSPSDVSSYGIIAGKEVAENLYEISEMIEKPSREEAPSNLAIIGRYLLTPDLFEALTEVKQDAKGEIQLTNGLRLLLKKRPIYGYKFRGTRYDAGNKLGFLKATVEIALKRKDLGEAFRKYLLSLKLQ